MSKKALVIGLGFAGSVIARTLADAGFSVTAIEKRAHIGGNMFEYERVNGVRVHLYGPHIFHTNIKRVYEYLSKFSSFYPYSHRVLGKIDGKLVPIPFNFTSIDELFLPNRAEYLKGLLSAAFPGRDRVQISDLLDNNDPDIHNLGCFIYEKVFVNYSCKQWGIPIEMLDQSVINRVPVIIGTDDRYFPDSIQMMPLYGFTALFEKMLDHPNIHINLNTDAFSRIRLHADADKFLLDGVPFDGPVCYSGAIEDLFDSVLGSLPYRSLDLRFEDHHVDCFQPGPVVNYPNDEFYTRITEFKHITLQDVPEETTILKEYPISYQPGSNMVPFYPIQSESSKKKYLDYLKLSRKYEDLYLCGRLAEYTYFNMDAVIDKALSVSEKILSSGKYE